MIRFCKFEDFCISLHPNTYSHPHHIHVHFYTYLYTELTHAFPANIYTIYGKFIDCYYPFEIIWNVPPFFSRLKTYFYIYSLIKFRLLSHCGQSGGGIYLVLFSISFIFWFFDISFSVWVWIIFYLFILCFFLFSSLNSRKHIGIS